MSRTVMPASHPRLSRVHPAVRSSPPPAPFNAGRAQHDEKTIFCARETDVAKCMIVEVEWYTPPTAARVPAEPVQCSSDDVSHSRTPEVGGLWAIEFGIGGNNGSPDVLYFADGINGEMDGLFGAITAH